jgi:hypothetical protein
MNPGQGGRARWGIFLFVFLMVFREGVETVLLGRSGWIQGFRLGRHPHRRSAICSAWRLSAAPSASTCGFFKVTGHSHGGGGATRPHRPARTLRIPGAPQQPDQNRILGPIVKSDVFFFITIWR